MFDGRSLPNPGREERFKPLTGKDQPVIDYLLSGIEAGMVLPDPADPSLETIRVMR